MRRLVRNLYQGGLGYTNVGALGSDRVYYRRQSVIYCPSFFGTNVSRTNLDFTYTFVNVPLFHIYYTHNSQQLSKVIFSIMKSAYITRTHVRIFIILFLFYKSTISLLIDAHSYPITDNLHLPHQKHVMSYSLDRIKIYLNNLILQHLHLINNIYH